MSGKEIKVQLQPHNFSNLNNISGVFLLRNTLGKSSNDVALEYQAKHDNVSRTLNKTGILKHLSNEIEYSTNTTIISLIILRLDNFNEISSSLGNDATNKILKSFASRLYSFTDKYTTIGKIDTADFLLIKNNLNHEENIQDYVNKLIKYAKHSINTSGISVELTLHAGVANYPAHGKTAKALVMNANLALASALQKHKTLDQYTDKSVIITKKPAIKLADIQTALKDNQLRLYYQPILDFKDHSVSSVEELLRWKHPKHGLILPDKFIELVEHSKLVRPVTSWVINRALKDAKSWKNNNLDIKVSVNISERNLLDAHFPKIVAQSLNNNMKPEYLELEISETKLQPISEQAFKLLKRLKNCGVSFTLDNFGKGNTSLHNLRDLPFSKIKIHRSLTTNVIKSNQDALVIDAIIRLAHSYNISVIAGRG